MATFIIFPVTKQIAKIEPDEFFANCYRITYKSGMVATIDDEEASKYPIIHAEDWKDLNYDSIALLYFR